MATSWMKYAFERFLYFLFQTLLPIRVDWFVNSMKLKSWIDATYLPSSLTRQVLRMDRCQDEMKYERCGLCVCQFTITLEYSLVNTKVRLSVYKLRRFDQISLRRWRRNMIMYHDFSRTHVQTHSGQRVLKSPRRFIESAVALCFNSPKYLRKWRRQLRLHHNHPRKFWERLHWLIGTFPFYTRYLFEKVS